MRLLLSALAMVTVCGARAAMPDCIDVTFDLHREAIVRGTVVTMADVADVIAANAQIKRNIEAIPVATAPRAGQVEMYSRTDLERLLSAQLARMAPGRGKSDCRLAWTGANAVYLSTMAQTLQMERLAGDAQRFVRAQLEAQLRGEVDAVELSPNAMPADIELPLGEVSWKPRPLDLDRLHALQPVWMDVAVDGKPNRAVVLTFALNLKANAFVARRDLTAGQRIVADDFEQKMVDVTDAPRNTVRNIASGTRIGAPLLRGHVLTYSQLARQGAVFSGDAVTLTVAEGGVSIETHALAEQDGNIGQTVMVRPSTGVAAIKALIVAPGLVKAGGI